MFNAKLLFVIRTEVPASKYPFWLLKLFVVTLPNASRFAEFANVPEKLPVKLPPVIIFEVPALLAFTAVIVAFEVAIIELEPVLLRPALLLVDQ